MAIVISGSGIDMGGNPVSNASQVDSTVINESGSNVRTESDSYSKTEVDGKIVGFKNYIINGGFDIWQRGTSQTSHGYGSDDRWGNASSVTTKIHSQVACADEERALFNASYFSRTVVSSVANAGAFCYKYQRIEDITKLAGKTITISFWAKADSSKNIAIEFYRNFGTGGTPSTTDYLTPQLIALTSTWEKKIITISIPSIVGKTLGTDGPNTSFLHVGFWFDAGSNVDSRTASLGQQSGTFDIAQVQIEEGSVATPFENRPYGLELSLCQRYYEIGKVTNYHPSYSGTGWDVVYIMYSSQKRIKPTLSSTDNNGTVGKTSYYSSTSATILNGATVGYIAQSVDGVGIGKASGDGLTSYGPITTWAASAEL